MGENACPVYTGNGTGREDGILTCIGVDAGFALLQGASNTHDIFVGEEAGFSATSAFNSLFFGDHSATAVISSQADVFIGASIASQNVATSTTTNNVAIGYTALFSMNGANNNNVLIGDAAGYTQAAASSNVGIGYQALNLNTVGNQTAVGTQAAVNVSTGARTVAVGYQAAHGVTTGSDNTAIGYQAGSSETGNYQNTFVGSLAGANATGVDETTIGYKAGYTITSGTNDTIIGNLADVSAASDSNEIVIGSIVTGAGSNTFVAGPYGTTDLYAGYASSGGAVRSTGHFGALYSAGVLNFNGTGTPGVLTAGAPTSSGACTAGTHSYKATFVNAAGESLPSATSSVITCVTATGQTVPLSSVPLGPLGTTSRNIYRTIAGNGGSYLLLTTLANNTATTFSDTIADGSLGAAAPASDTTAIGSFQVAGSQKATLSSTGLFSAGSFGTTTQCQSSASPSVCGSAAAGFVAVPTGVTSVTLQVNTSAVTANSTIMLTSDDTLGAALGVTCNSTLATLVGGMAITARSAGASFTVTYNGTIATNPLCLSYAIVN
jgi:hypothetical protein